MGNTTSFQLDSKMNKLLYLNFKRRSKNCALVLKNSKKNLKPNVLPRPNLKNPDLNFLVILKNITLLTNQPFPAFAKSMPRLLLKCLNKLTIFKELNKSWRRKNLK